MKNYNVLSLFSGAGGLDLGFENAGFKTKYCIEKNKNCVDTLTINQQNFNVKTNERYFDGAKILEEDINEHNFDEIIDNIEQNNLVIIGGPPCQPYSVIGKRMGVKDNRASTITIYYNFIKTLKPKAFLFENVPGFLSIDNKNTATNFEADLGKHGYKTNNKLLNAADYGSATLRKRFFIIGILDAEHKPNFPEPTHSDNNNQLNFINNNKNDWITSWERIKNIEETSPNSNIVNHDAKVIERFKNLEWGERDQIRRRNRLHPERPSFTIFAGGSETGAGARTHIHPFKNRELTPRECAALHDFPDNYIFSGNRDNIILQVANSVPVNLATAIARELIKQLKFK